MQWSRYNEIISATDGFCYLFNSFTKQWIKMEATLSKLVNEHRDAPDKLLYVHPSLYKVLEENDFLVNSTEEEAAKCLQSIQEKLEDSSVWKLTINPTLDCNLRCWYCYESHLKGSAMSEGTIEKVKKLISKELGKGKVKMFQLAFFGGEPLLKYSAVVLPILVFAKQACERYGVHFGVSFTSNSVCLTTKVVDKLKSLCENVAVQVPFDGGKECHNGVKHFANGKGSYDIVRNNIIYAIKQGIRVNIRCNYTLKSLSSFQDVVDDFKEYHHFSNLRFSFHKVWQESDSPELKEEIKKLKNYTSKYQFKSNINTHFGSSVNPCYGDYTQNIVVNYNGDVFRCTARDFKPEHRLGVLAEDGTVVFNPSNSRRIKSRFTKDCAMCKRLPFCPICSQVRSESSDGHCPVRISDEDIKVNVHKYFYDLTGVMYVNASA